MGEALNPDLLNWAKKEKSLKGRGKPRECECGALVISKTLIECPKCRSLLPSIDILPDKDV